MLEPLLSDYTSKDRYKGMESPPELPTSSRHAKLSSVQVPRNDEVTPKNDLQKCPLQQTQRMYTLNLSLDAFALR